MKSTPVILIYFFALHSVLAQETELSPNQLEFNKFISNLESEFIYYEEKQEVIECISQRYGSVVDTISHPYYKVLFYERLLNELYDSHIQLNTNTDESYRLDAPFYIQWHDGKFKITNVFSELKINFSNVLNAEIIAFNGTQFAEVINAFPTSCHDKNNPIVREWLANKILAGRRDQPRILTLKLLNDQQIKLDLDYLQYKSYEDVLSSSIKDNVGYIRINNSLGDMELVKVFDQTIENMLETDAIILDLRNTPDGGGTDIAEPILGRFISKERGYQVCENKNEKYTRKVFPRGKTYTKSLYVLVGRWTGSMGEGMAIGFDGMKRGTVIGTEMARLAGGIKAIKFINSDFSYRISFEKMYHLNGNLRENFIPDTYINQSDLFKDEFLEKAYELINHK